MKRFLRCGDAPEDRDIDLGERVRGWLEIAQEMRAISPNSPSFDRICEVVRNQLQIDHMYAIECGPAHGHQDDGTDASTFGFPTCPHPDCRLVREMPVVTSTPDRS